MENKSDYLKQYNSNVEIIGRQDYNASSFLNALPAAWQIILSKESWEEQLKGIIALWQKYCYDELSITISYISNNCIGIDVIKVDDRFSILYSIKNEKGAVLFYEGPFPDKKSIEAYSDKWNRFPPEITSFYENIHNGFYYYASGSMGLSALNDVFSLGEEYWGITEELTSPLQINMETTYAFFTNGMGSYVCFDIEKNQPVLWSAKNQPKYAINFWDVIDEWIVIGFDS